MLKKSKNKYIIAVSGGVDSMALLDMLVKNKVNLTVVNIDHGIRSDGQKDRELVEGYCRDNNIKFIFKELNLGEHASEDTARIGRYKVLRECLMLEGADAIITAHHQDDMIETALINLIRGTGWRGIAPFALKTEIVRPLLGYTKKQIVDYAKKNNLAWNDDQTNANEAYLRNYIRLTLLPKLKKRDADFYETFLKYILQQQKIRLNIQEELDRWVNSNTRKKNGVIEVDRYKLIMLPSDVAYEVMQHIFKVTCDNTLERSLAQSALLFAKVASPGKMMPLGSDWLVRATKTTLTVEPNS